MPKKYMQTKLGQDVEETLRLRIHDWQEDCAIIKEIAKAYEDVGFLGKEIVYDDHLDVYFPYLSCLSMKYKMAKEGGESQFNNNLTRLVRGNSTSCESDEDESCSISTTCSQTSVLHPVTQRNKTGQTFLSESCPLFIRKGLSDRLNVLISEKQILDVVTLSDIETGSMLIVLWNNIESLPRIQKYVRKKHLIYYDLANPKKEEIEGKGTTLTFPIIGMISDEDGEYLTEPLFKRSRKYKLFQNAIKIWSEGPGRSLSDAQRMLASTYARSESLKQRYSFECDAKSSPFSREN